jgi:arsenate reductase
MKTILFLCTHNSARSQIAEGLVNANSPDRYQAFSAGTEPRGVHPLAIQVLKELGIDISKQYSKNVKDLISKKFDLVVTLCDQAKGTCPAFPGAKKVIHRSFADPSIVPGTSEEKLQAFRKTREEIKEWLKVLLLTES